MPEPIGGAVYALDLDTGQFVGNSRQAQAQFDQLKAKGDAVARSSGGISTAFGGVARTAVAVALGMGGLNIAVTGVKEALTSTVVAAANEAASEARLQAAVAASGASYGDYSKQLGDVIAKGEELGFSREQSRASLALLVAQTDSVTEATKRYTTAQNVARLTGLDIVTASRLIGKVTDDNVAALNRYGFAVKKGSTEAEFFAVINAKAAGQAKAFADSAAGQFERTKLAIADAGIAVGTVLLPSVIAAAEGIARGARDVESFTGKLSGASTVARDVFPSLVTGALAFGVAIAAVNLGNLISGLLAAREAAAGTSLALTGLGQLGMLLSTPTGAAVGLGAAIIAADIASRKLTGSGLIDWLDGTAQSAQRAAAAEKKYGDSVGFVNQLVREGVTLDRAHDIGLKKAIDDAMAAQTAGIAKLQGAAKEAATADLSGFLGGLSGETQKNLVSSLAGGDEAIKKLADNIRAGNPTYQQWLDILKRVPILQTEITGDVENARLAYEAAAKAAGTYANSVEAWDKAITDAKKGLSDLKTAQSDLEEFAKSAVEGVFGPELEGLKAEKLALEQRKTAMGDAFGEANQDKLDELTRRIDLTTKQQEIATQSVTRFGAEVQQQYGALAPDVIKNVNDALIDVQNKFGKPETIKLLIALPNLVQIQDVFKRFIEALRSGATVDVAVRVAAIGAFPKTDTTPLPGETPAQTGRRLREESADTLNTPVQNRPVSSAAQDVIDQFNNEMKAFNDSTARASSGDLGAIADKGAAAKQLTQQEQDLQALAAAFAKWHAETGGSIRDFMVFLKVEADRQALEGKLTQSSIDLSAAQQEQGDGQVRLLQIGQKLSDDQLALIQRQTTATAALAAAQIEEADASYRLREIAAKVTDDQLSLIQREQAATAALAARQLEAADASYQLRLAFVEIEEAAIAAGTSIPVQVAKIFGSIVDNANSALDALLNKPTREGTALQLRIDTLQREADILIRGGADATRVGKPGATAADKQLAAVEAQIKALDQEKKIRADDLAIMKDHAILANQQLDTDRAIVGAYTFLIAVIHNVSLALNGLINPLQAFAQPGGGGGFSDQEKAYIDAVARLKGEPEPFPGYETGTPFVPQTGPALLHKGERVLTAADNAKLSSIGGTADAIVRVLSGDVIKSTELHSYLGGTDNRDLSALLAPRAPLLRVNAGLEGLNFAPRFTPPETAGRGAAGVTIEKGAIQNNFTINADMSDEAVERLAQRLEQTNERSLGLALRRGSLRPVGTFSGR